MTRLIDADSIPWLVEGVGEIPVITKEEIDQMPTVDAVPVRHGKWIEGKSDGHVRCTVCKKDFDWTSEAQYFDYCPHCGARMDKE